MIELTEIGIVPRCQDDLQGPSDFNAVLLAMAAHDLRQPLQLILGAFYRLRQQLGPGARTSNAESWRSTV